MYRSIFVLAILMALQSACLAQFIIKGRVDNTDGRPIPKATVTLDGEAIAVASEEGRFILTDVSKGRHEILISATGYRELTQKIELSADRELGFQLQTAVLYLQPIEIMAVRAGGTAPFTKTDLKAADIRPINLGQDLPILLNQTPSVVVNSDAGNGVGYTALRIRGTDLTRINVTLNGIPYNDAESQGSFFVDLPDFASSVGSIQVQRGVGTSSNGAGAFGATINMTTNELNEKAYGELNNAYGSFNTWKNTVKAGSGLLNDHFTIDARLSRISSDGYIDRASSDLQSFYLSTAYHSERSSLRFNIFSGKEKTYQAWYGVPEYLLATNRRYNPAGTEKPGEPYENETDNFVQTHYQLFYNQQLNQRLSFSSAFYLTRGKGFYEQYKAQQAFDDYGLPAMIDGEDSVDLIRQLWLDNYLYGNIFSLQYKGEGIQAILGGGWNRYDGNHYGEVIWSQSGFYKDYRWYDLDAKKTDFNLYLKLQRELAQGLEAFGDLQYRRVVYNLDGFRNNPELFVCNTFNFFNPKVGLSYSRSGWFTYASYAHARKEPNRDDFEAGLEQKPLPESLHDVEAGIEKRNKRTSWSATLYYMRYKDQLVLTGRINDVGAYTRTNIPESYRAGVELQGSWKPADWLEATGNVAISRNRVLDFVEFYDDYDAGGQKFTVYNETPLAFSPSIVGGATIRFFPVKNWEIALPAKYVSRQFLDNTGSDNRSLAPYFTQDLRMRYTLNNRFFSQIELIAQVNNIFNNRYEANGYTYSYILGGELTTENYYFPMASTNYMLGLNIRL